MITLITGTPGSGKSLRAVWLITKALENGRPVFCDIDGINLSGVTSLPPGEPHDWRDTPEGSLVVYDEVQQRWPSTGKPGAAPQEEIRALEVHRHTAHDIIVITQHPTMVHHHVRKLVGQHIHVRRTSGAGVVTLFSNSEVFDPADKSALRNVDKETWRYPKNLYKCYKSATAHTVKFKLPAKLKYLAIFILVMIGFLVWLVSTFDNPFASDSEPPSGQSEAATAAARSTPDTPLRSYPMSHPDHPSWVRNQEVLEAASVDSLPTISGCFAMSDTCRCWDAEGYMMQLTDSQCGLLLAHMPRSLGGYSSGSNNDSRLDAEGSTSRVSYVPMSGPQSGFRANGSNPMGE